MATFIKNFMAKYQTTKDADIQQKNFAVGDAVTVIKIWEHFFLIKDTEGHFYNIPKEYVKPV